tara:strand:+ start:938 stop:1672 length:735 start_codon:yes stop_codon:yes gene_type:complete
MKKIGIIVQARSTSSRFNRKIFKKIYKNYSVLEFLLKRLSSLGKKYKLIIGTTKKDQKKISNISKKYNFIVDIGSERNVLSRFYKIAKKNKLEIVVRVNSDSPLLIDRLIEKYLIQFIKNKKIDYMTNILKPSFPYGLAVEIFKFNVLKKAFLNAKNKQQKEHVTPYIYQNKKKFLIRHILNKKNLSKYRFCIDYPQDLKLLKIIIKRSKSGTNLSYIDAINILKKDKKLMKINEKFNSTFFIK